MQQQSSYVTQGARTLLPPLAEVIASSSVGRAMTDPTTSPAQKVLAAFNDRYELCGQFDDNWVELCLAAAFREAANHMGSCNAAFQLLAIAVELEAQP